MSNPVPKQDKSKWRYNQASQSLYEFSCAKIEYHRYKPRHSQDTQYGKRLYRFFAPFIGYWNKKRQWSTPGQPQQIRWTSLPHGKHKYGKKYHQSRTRHNAPRQNKVGGLLRLQFFMQLRHPFFMRQRTPPWRWYIPPYYRHRKHYGCQHQQFDYLSSFHPIISLKPLRSADTRRRGRREQGGGALRRRW